MCVLCFSCVNILNLTPAAEPHDVNNNSTRVSQLTTTFKTTRPRWRRVVTGGVGTYKVETKKPNINTQIMLFYTRLVTQKEGRKNIKHI